MTELLFTGLLLGLAGSLHCVGMCGPIVTALSLSSRTSSFSKALLATVLYNLGRLNTYIIIGLVFGLVGEFGDSVSALKVLRLLAAILLIATGLYLTNIWRGVLVLEKLGQGLWRKVQPLTGKLNPSKSVFHSYLSGLLWGLLPCGLVYTAAAIASSYGTIANGALFMLAFGAGTFLPMVLMGIGFTSISQWLQQTWVRYSVAFSLIVLGSYSVYSLVAMSTHKLPN
ncbi:MAG: sulfite exporter TauE/SafE family protein [Kangiellaceae bacterium]|jgi:sulfite exporter TauE/SafE|nr:sulfite exporter TauE/SafE family protein [Kangiellaceae bacterium]